MHRVHIVFRLCRLLNWVNTGFGNVKPDFRAGWCELRPCSTALTAAMYSGGRDLSINLVKPKRISGTSYLYPVWFNVKMQQFFLSNWLFEGTKMPPVFMKGRFRHLLLQDKRRDGDKVASHILEASDGGFAVRWWTQKNKHHFTSLIHHVLSCLCQPYLLSSPEQCFPLSPNLIASIQLLISTQCLHHFQHAMSPLFY